MMVKIARVLLLLAVILAIPSHAVQFGFEIGASEGDGNVNLYLLPSTHFDISTQEFGFALNVCEHCRVINYRLNVGYASAKLDYGSGLGRDRADAMNITNTLGLKFIDNDSVKVWVGGSIYLDWVSMEGSVIGDDYSLVQGVGPTLGFDIHLDDGTAIGFELSSRNLNSDPFWGERYEIDDLIFRLNFFF